MYASDRPAFRAARADGEAIRSIARRTGASRNAVRRGLRSERDRYRRDSRSEQLEEGVREVLALYPRMIVADVAVLVDWQMSMRTLHAVVAKLRPAAVENWEPGMTVGRTAPQRITADRLTAPALAAPRLEVRRVS